MRLLRAPLALFAPLKRVGYGLLFALGAGVAVLFIAFSLLVDVQSLAVLLAAIGAALGALIVGLAAPKLLVAAGSQREKQLAADLADALARRSQLAAEIERVKSQQLQVQQVQAVLKLTLLEVDTTLTDFKTTDLGQVERVMGGTESHRYVGVLRKRAKVMLGIDLGALRVKELPGTLVIDGLRAQYQGVREDREDWLLRQIHVEQDNVMLSNKTVVLRDDARLIDAAAAHADDLDERLRNGVELKAFDAALERLGDQWLRALLAPMGVQLRFAPLADGEARPFVDYLAARLAQLSGQQARLELAAAALAAPPAPGGGAGRDDQGRM
jgi:uncharacterized ubiquitin-like protein YukD